MTLSQFHDEAYNDNHQALQNASVWVPEAVQRYLTHTEAGLTIREVARQSGCHASTVLRQIRKIETRRDDPLIDRALIALSSKYFHGTSSFCAKEPENMNALSKLESPSNAAPDMERQAQRILRRLCESGAVLAVAKGMETAVVVREAADGSTAKTASVSADFVSALALNAWIECLKPGRISRYRITAAGRAKLEALNAAVGACDFDDPDAQGSATEPRRIRYSVVESPVAGLARRKGKDGAPFLDETLVNAAERLREDFELAQMGPRVAQNWDNFLTPGSQTGQGPRHNASSSAPMDARDRVAKALLTLGPGLGDVALRCCCYLEGLETTEKRMGWSARSGKIVLRIALQRLKQFYDTEMGDVLIG